MAETYVAALAAGLRRSCATYTRVVAEIRVLGPIQGFRDGQPVDLGGPTQRRLLASLVAQPDEVVPVTVLLEHLWGDDPPPSGPQSIQSYVSRLRRSLGPDVIETRAPGYRLGGGLEIDSVTFLSKVAGLSDDPSLRLGEIEEALALWSGPPFEDFDHVDFAARRLLETRYDLEEERAALLSAAGRTSQAIEVLERVIAAEPLRESAWISLSRVLANAGRQAEALRTLDRYRSRISEIGLEPGPMFREAEDQAFEPPTVTPTRPALPRSETVFVGRSDELSEVRRLLHSNHLVTITGPGGMGKTRLAIEAVRDWEGEEEVVFVRLDGLRDEGDVAPTVLHALGAETRGDPIESVVARLTRTPALLILDNAEHVIDTTATLVAELLDSTDARLLITSREPLNTVGENVVTLDHLDSASAISLFRCRALLVNPGFEAPSSTLDMICEELDYMPLAIEMAASRANALSSEEMLTRLSRQFGLLDKPVRGAAKRHRNLDALVEWSYDLLSEGGRRVFERLAVLIGSFDIDTAIAVAGFGEVQSDAVAGIVADLVDRSLLNRSMTGGFRMLRILKSFALQRLDASSDAVQARANHARRFAALATAIGDGLSTPRETDWVELANATVEDMGVALAWSIDNDDLDTAKEILEGLFDWLYHRQPPAILRWGDLTLPHSEDHDVRAVASAWASLAALKSGAVERAREIAESGTTVEGNASRFAWFMTGEVAMYQNRLEDSLDAFRKQLVRAGSLEDRIGVIDAMAGETLALSFQGVFDRAEDIAIELERLSADLGAPTYRAYARYALGEAVIDRDQRRSAELLDDAAEIAASVNNCYIQAIARSTLGSVQARVGDHEAAKDTLDRAMELWEALGMPAFQWTIVKYMGGLIASQGDVERGVRLISAARHAGRRPFGPGQRHWREMLDELKTDPRFPAWWESGGGLSLPEAMALAESAHSLG